MFFQQDIIIINSDITDAVDTTAAQDFIDVYRSKDLACALTYFTDMRWKNQIAMV